MRRLLSLISVASLLLALVALPAAAGSRVDIIVVFHDGVVDARAAAVETAARHGVELGFVYEHALAGFSGSVAEGRLRGLQQDPRVASVERDQIVSIAAQTVPTGISRIFADDNAEIDIDGSDDFRVDVDVAVIDTGVDVDHVDLNYVGGTNCAGGSPFKSSCDDSQTGDDDNGHGTHVAGSIGAIDDGNGVVGVAPGARIWSVKVLRSDGSGYMSWIVAGIDWVTARANTIEVANMSLGCECSSSAMDTAISNSVNEGVAYAVAAGNSDKDASTFSPANHPDVLTVSALADFDGAPGANGSPTCRSDEDDTLANFSNFGATVEIAAPGVCILSTWNDGGYHTISGTSMASPHAAGALALLASGAGDPTTKAAVEALYDTVIGEGNVNWTDDSGDGVQEPLLDVSDATVFNPTLVSGGGGTDGGGDGGGGGGEDPPSEGLTLSVTAYKVKGVQHADLDWGGTTATSVDVYRDGTLVATTSDDPYTDSTGNKGGGSVTYKVCEAGTSTCSSEVTVTY